MPLRGGTREVGLTPTSTLYPLCLSGTAERTVKAITGSGPEGGDEGYPTLAVGCVPDGMLEMEV